jgi:hypothetical protein
MEIAIDSQKQTIQARDDSIKKLLELLQSKGISEFSNGIFTSFHVLSFHSENSTHFFSLNF